MSGHSVAIRQPKPIGYGRPSTTKSAPTTASDSNLRSQHRSTTYGLQDSLVVGSSWRSIAALVHLPPKTISTFLVEGAPDLVIDVQSPQAHLQYTTNALYHEILRREGQRTQRPITAKCPVLKICRDDVKVLPDVKSPHYRQPE